MNKIINEMTDKLLANSTNKLALKALEKLFNTGIPFNRQHKFKFTAISEGKTQLKLPHIRANKNHLGGIHACATATLGEYAAGLTLIKKFSSSKYRLVMSKMEADYIKQAKEDLYGVVEIEKEELERIENELAAGDKSEITIVTNIFTKEDEIIAVIQTSWQLKKWNRVTYK